MDHLLHERVHLYTLSKFLIHDNNRCIEKIKNFFENYFIFGTIQHCNVSKKFKTF